MDEALIRQLKNRVEEELRQRELALLEFWLEAFQTIMAKRHKELAGIAERPESLRRPHGDPAPHPQREPEIICMK